MSNKGLIFNFVMVNYLYVVFMGVVMCASSVHRDGKVICTEIPKPILEEVLGAAFNARYMSIHPPVIETKEGGKRTTHEDLDFFVDSEFKDEAEEQPAWSVKNHVASSREKRETRTERNSDYKQQWHCKSIIKWLDLGPDYFPRYLRSLECTASNCWFNLYKCKPRSFTIKILRRRRDRCVLAGPGTRVGNVGLPKDLKELWIWEERAVTFCCDCTI